MEKLIYLPSFLNPIKFDDLIRIGKQNDGGYIVRRQDVVEAENLISLGVSFDWTFEKEFSKINKKIKLKTYDGSTGFKYFRKSSKTRLKNFLKNPNKLNLQRLYQRLKVTLDFCIFFRFNLSSQYKHTEKFVGKETRTFSEFEKNYGYKPEFIEFKDIVSNSHENVFLSIDIEGSEYDILQYLHELTDNLVGLNIEFHNVDKNLDKIEKFIKKSNLLLIHTHINNFGPISNDIPTVIELSFSKNRNRNLTSECSMTNELPISLDQPNDKNGIDYSVKFKLY